MEGLIAMQTSVCYYTVTIDYSSLQVREYLVDIFQFRFADFRANLALSCDCDCFGEILRGCER